MVEGLSGECGGDLDSTMGAICFGVCNSHEVCPIASSIRRIYERSEVVIDAKSYFLATRQTSCKATPPLLRLFEYDCNKSMNQMRI